MLQQHPLSAAFPAKLDDLLSFNYSATTADRKLLAVTHPSKKHPGHVHYSVITMPQGLEVHSRRPVRPEFVAPALESIIASEGTSIGGMIWLQCEVHASDWDAPTIAQSKIEYIYFIVAGPFIKIGKTTGYPGARISELQTGCPYVMRLVGSMAGGIKEEMALHRQFSEFRVRSNGEWFRYEGALAEFVASLGAVHA